MAQSGGYAEPTVGLSSFLSDALRAVPGRAATFYTPDLAYGAADGFWRATGLPSEALGDYMNHFREEDLWARAVSRRPRLATGAVLDTDSLVDPERLASSAFYDGFLRPYEIGRCLVGMVDDGRNAALPRVRLTVIRAASEAGFSSADHDRFALLTQLARSFVLLARAHESATRSSLLQQSTIDLLRMPVLIVDAERRIEVANRSARHLLQASASLLRRDGRLHARDSRADLSLGEALRRVAAAPADVRVVRLGIGRPAVRAPALIVSAITDPLTGSAAALSVRVLGPEPLPADAETLLSLLLDLTPPEAAVALGLAEGLSHDEIARRRGVKVTTVRTTLRRLQEKLGIERSSRLARFVLGLTSLGGLRL